VFYNFDCFAHLHADAKEQKNNITRKITWMLSDSYFYHFTFISHNCNMYFQQIDNQYALHYKSYLKAKRNSIIEFLLAFFSFK